MLARHRIQSSVSSGLLLVENTPSFDLNFILGQVLGCCSTRDKVIFPPFRLVFFVGIDCINSAVAMCVATFFGVSDF